MKCPTCEQPVKWQDNPFRPFCSERCKMIDFGRWVNEEYRVPGPEAPPSDADKGERPASGDVHQHEEE